MNNQTWLYATGDVCSGDTIRFVEDVWGGTYRKPTHLGRRQIVAEVLSDSYGALKQQHTFSLRVIEVDYDGDVQVGATIRRKGRTIYRYQTERLHGDEAFEAARVERLAEKHARGAVARKYAAARKEGLI